MTKNVKKRWAITLNSDTKLERLIDVLPNNEDTFKLPGKSSKEPWKVNSKESFISYVKGCAHDYKQHKIIVTGNVNMKFTADDVINILSQYKLIKLKAEKIDKTTSDISYWTKDYDDTLSMYTKANIDELTNIIYEELQLRNFNAIISHVNARLSKMSPYMHKFEELNEPDEDLILTNNGLLNTKTFNFTTNQKTIAQYDFVSKLDFRILHPSQVKPEHFETHKRTFNDWAQGDEDKVLYLKQICLSSIDGNGRNVLHLLVGSGGNGKSSFLAYPTILSGRYYADLNLQDIMDDNKLNDIYNNTKVIAGHELATNIRLGSSAISRMKLFITADPIKVNVKYMPARIIANKGLKIQATNTLPKIFENTDAIRRRLRIFNWTNVDFSKLDTQLDLDSLQKKPDFIEALIAYIFCDVEPFEKFKEIKEMTEATDALVNESDQVYQFLQYLDEQELLVGKLLINVVYELYKNWNRDENGNISPLKQRDLTDRLKKLAPDFDMAVETNRTRGSAMRLLDFNIKALNEYFGQSINFQPRNKSAYLICKEQITNYDIKDFKNRLENNEIDIVDSYKDLLIFYHLIYKGDYVATAFYELMKDKGY
jgi:poxvirus D5 protein-like